MIIGICGVSVVRGVDIVRFSLDMTSVASPAKRMEIVNGWSLAPNVASSALQADLAYQINPADQKAAVRRRQEIAALISIKPMSSYDWLSLSGVQLITDQPMEQVFQSLELSILTGPNEGYLMEDRGIFGVSLWATLSADLKRRVAADLTVGDLTNDRLRNYLSAQPEQVRKELREALIAAGLPSKEIEKRLKF
jgi:hypothetical protein